MYKFLQITLLSCFLFIACSKDGMECNTPSNTDTTQIVTDTTTQEPIDTTSTDPDTSSTVSNYYAPISGVSFESPSREFPSSHMSTIQTEVASGWIAISPFAFTRPGTATVVSSSGQWWGERLEGVETITNYAREYNLKVMVKPQVWMSWGDWVGNFDLETEEDWKIWEEQYTNYIMPFAELAEKQEVEIFCVGTEYRIVAVKRPEYWRNLIKQVRSVYSGKITYASNWDNYQKVTFWDDLDYIGIDSYFPLVDAITPEVEDLKKAWEKDFQEIKHISERFDDKQILFTEYGYMSVDKSGWKNWENEADRDNLPVNLQAQVNCFEAFFQTFWQQEWFAGGFIWKWHAEPSRGGTNNNDYTPQNKPVEATIKKWHEK